MNVVIAMYMGKTVNSGKPNHFTECSWEKKGKGGKHKAKKAHEVKENESEEEEDDLDALVTDEITVRKISSASEPDAVQVNETQYSKK